jgi:hypothetical protein
MEQDTTRVQLFNQIEQYQYKIKTHCELRLYTTK